MMLHCDKAEKHGNLCLGYGTEGGEPCEICKNCIKCESGYYQLRETKKDEQLTKAKEIIEGLMRFCRCFAQHHAEDIRYKEAEQFLKEE